MLDIRLDFISNITPNAIEAMTLLRKLYIDMDLDLQNIEDIGCDEENKSASLRCIAMARTNLEISLQYAIKALCLAGEIKE